MEIWAKLFESNGRQVLVTKDYDDDDNPKVSFSVRIEGAELSLGPCFSGEDGEMQRDNLFDSADQQMADNFTKPLIGCETVLEAAKALSGN
ncbi:hypothetical protein [Pantoea ananatis]|jgi:hypothetical protein|uniref:hypothetical protein n=1 Tax=Pantoea ananas TaxID=553 RepID=UPI0025C7BBA8|nr:hypothetical protein [Pantoea ananatis]MDN4131880.1 hypothetical protein [Pantoea ananatis]